MIVSMAPMNRPVVRNLVEAIFSALPAWNVSIRINFAMDILTALMAVTNLLIASASSATTILCAQTNLSAFMFLDIVMGTDNVLMGLTKQIA